MFTFLGLAVNSWAAVLFALGRFRQAAAVLFLAGFLDMADGQVARRVGRVTAFGAFLDSTLDRYSDLALYLGLVVYYTLIGRSFYMALAAVAMASSFTVSYTHLDVYKRQQFSCVAIVDMNAARKPATMMPRSACGTWSFTIIM